MAISNLRTGITIKQERKSVSPNIQATTLPAVLVGLNRALYFQKPASIFDWSAGTVASNVAFPSYVSGLIEAGVANPALEPKFFVKNTLGIAEITDSVTINDIDTGTPSFTIASGFSAIFQIAAGTAGCFVANTTTETSSTFKDTGADFVYSQVRRGDTIKVSGVAEYVVHGVTSDSELTVRRLGKGPETIGAIETAKLHLSKANTEDLRTLTARSDSFADAGGFGQTGTKVKAGDILRVNNWENKVNSGGVEFSRVGETEGDVISSYVLEAEDRTVTFPSASPPVVAILAAETSGSGDSLVVTPRSVLMLQTQDGFLVPAMYAVSTHTGGVIAARDFAQSPVTADTDADFGAAYKLVTFTVVQSGTNGSFTTLGAGDVRTFSRATGDLPAMAAGGSEQYILIKDATGVYRPMFYVDETAGAIAAPSRDVKQFADSELDALAYANNVSYKVVDFVTTSHSETKGNGIVSVTYSEVASPAVYGTTTGNVSTEVYDAADFGGYVLTANDRILSLLPAIVGAAEGGSPVKFLTGVAVGDYIFSDNGTLMFKVKAIPTHATANFSMVVTLATQAGVALDAAETLSNFGFSVRNGTKRADFVVRRVINDTQLEVKATASSPNQIQNTSSVNGMLAFTDETNDLYPISVTVGDSAVGVSYTVEKTVSGASLSGDILVTYAVVRDDLVGIQEITASNYASVLGDDVIDNPLGLAARIYFSNSSNNVFVVQVKADTTEGWLAAAEATKTDRVYNVVPLTQTESVLAMWRAHVIEQSLPTNKRERILWQSHRFLQNVELASWEFADNATVSRDADGIQTVEIGKDLVALGVSIGDDFTGKYFNGSVYQTFAGRITDVTLTGSVTTLGILPDGNLALSTADMVVTEYTIKSRPLSLAELKEEVKAYPATILERRIRNIYPDQCVVEFSDNTGDGETTGLYGGGQVTTTAGGHFVCVVEAAKRTAFGPAKPLTKRGGAGIYQILDSFAEAPGFQDEILDAGNYYMEQRTGAGSNVYTIRALTTDTRELITAEESVTPQIDSFVRRLRAQLTPLLGPEILDQRFFDLVSAVSQAVVSRTLTEKELKTIKLLSISESPDTADTFLMSYEVEPFFSGARGIITILF